MVISLQLNLSFKRVLYRNTKTTWFTKIKSDIDLQKCIYIFKKFSVTAMNNEWSNQEWFDKIKRERGYLKEHY